MKYMALGLVALALGAGSAEGAVFAGWNNQADGWTGIASYSSTIGVTEGTHSAAVSVPAGWSTAFVKSSWGLADTIAPLADNPLISIDVTVTDPIPGGSYLQIGFQFWNDAGAKFGGLTNVVQGTNHITVDTRTFFTPDLSNSTYGHVAVVTNPSAGYVPGTVYFDNMQMTAVPEPAALGVIGLAAALGLRRRRGA